MDNSRRNPDAMRAALEAALGKSLGAPSKPAVQPEAGPSMGSPVVVGEVVDTHHPHLPGRVLVRWYASAGTERNEWLHHERHLSLESTDRVLVTLPLGASEWLVTGALPRPTPAARSAGTGAERDGEQEATPAREESAARTVRLEPGQRLLVVAHDGAPLLALCQGSEGVVLELQRDEVAITAQRRLKLSANTIELAAGSGGVDIRTEGDAVTRARTIRLN